MKEKVLVFPASLVTEGSSFATSPLLKDADEIRLLLGEVFRQENLFYIDRDKAEVNPKFLQLIPYTVLRRGLEVFRYQRTKKGGEARLHANWSVGVGGHINPVDGQRGKESYQAAFKRELLEEVSLNLDHTPDVQALIFDPSNEVGKVHFGVVHIIQLGPNPQMEFLDPALSGGHFQHPVDLKASTDNFENWSRLVIDKLL